MITFIKTVLITFSIIALFCIFVFLYAYYKDLRRNQ